MGGMGRILIIQETHSLLHLSYGLVNIVITIPLLGVNLPSSKTALPDTYVCSASVACPLKFSIRTAMASVCL